MNRKLLFAAIALLVLLGIKYAFGQEEGGITWDPTFEGPGPEDYLYGVMTAAPIFGLIIGITKTLTQRHHPPILEPVRLK